MPCVFSVRWIFWGAPGHRPLFAARWEGMERGTSNGLSWQTVLKRTRKHKARRFDRAEIRSGRHCGATPDSLETGPRSTSYLLSLKSSFTRY